MNVIPFFRLTGHQTRNAQYLHPGEPSPDPSPFYTGIGLGPLGLKLTATHHLA